MEMKVPAIDFSGKGFRFQGRVLHETPDMMRLTAAVAAGAQILPIAAAVPHATYSISFNGPSLKCGPVEDPAIVDIIDTIYEQVRTKPQSSATFYVAFTPGLAVGPRPLQWPLMDKYRSNSQNVSWEKFINDCVVGMEDCNPYDDGDGRGITRDDSSDMLWLRLGSERL